MQKLIFITHGEVEIDPDVAVEQWGLNATGRAHHQAFCDDDVLRDVTVVYSSAEQKALDGAEILARARGLRHEVRQDLHENDRTATGYLPKEEFEHTADLFFAHPNESIRGWERAADAQARVVAALQDIAARERAGDIAIVAHGGVGALALCHFSGALIDRSWDQPGAGGGNYFVLSLPVWEVMRGWCSIGQA